MIAVLNGLVFVWVLLQLRADARARLADELAIEQDLGLDEALALTPGAMAPRRRGLADHDPALSPGSAAALSEPPATPFSAAGIFPDASPKPTLGRAGSAAPASTVSAAAAGGGPLGAATTGTAAALAVAPAPTRAAPLATKPSLPTWTPRASFEETGITGWFRSRFNERPIRPDRTATLRSEGGGRLDRMDLLLIVVLVVSTLLLRTFRLAEPYQMHFDEVYHARTATEFLQSWRYGISHDIYEWTHPHLAKYAMAGGLVAWGGDSVQSTSDLGVPVVAATVEPRRIDELAPGQRAGERLHVATGSEIRTYDLTTRDLVSVVPAPGASALTVDETGHRLVIGYADGQLATLDLDLVGDGGVETGLTPDVLVTVEQPIDRLFVTEDGGFVVVAGTERVTSVDLDAGTVAGTLDLPGVAALAGGGTGAALVAETDELTDPAAVASSLAEILSTDAAEYETLLTEAAPGTTVVLGDPGSGDARTALDAAISDGTLPGIRVDTVPRVAIATDDGVAFIDPTTASLITTIALDGGAHGLALVTGLDSPRLYVTTGLPGDPQYDVIAVGGDAAANGPVDQGLNPLPGGGASEVLYDPATQMVHILGLAPNVDDDKAGADGYASDVWTVYVVEPHGNAVFADARLPDGFTPTVLGCRFQCRVPGPGPPADPGLRRRRPVRGHRRRLARVRVAAARGDRRGPDGRAPVPARPDPVPAPARCRTGRAVRAGRRDVLRPVADRHERRVRRAVHHRRLHALRRDLDGLVEGQGRVLAGDARHRRPARAGAREQVGRSLRDRGLAAPDPGPQRPRSGAVDPGVARDHGRPRLHGDQRAGGGGRGRPWLREPDLPVHHGRADPCWP